MGAGEEEAQYRARWRDELRVLGVEIAEITPANQHELTEAIAAAKPHLVVGAVGDVAGMPASAPLASDGKARRHAIRQMIEGIGA